MLEARLAGRIEQRIRALGLPVAVTLWDGRSATPSAPPLVKFSVRSPKALAALADASMGRLARHYVEQELDVEGDVRDIVRMGEALSVSSPTGATDRSRVRKWFRHTRLFDRKAVRHHYDVGDDFFALWLDRRRVYSCAYFRRADDTLDIAQEQKLDHICRKLRLAPGERLLDVGCGWGALIQWAAERYRARALGVTLSENQYEYARRRIHEAGLEDRCEVRLLDYRDVPEDEPFDKIASVGMFEHVGRKNLPLYFGKLRRLLRPGGLVLNHGITLNAPELRELGSGIGEFIDDYVFPGGELTHISQVIEEMSAQGIECHDVESLRPHYARTLWHWCDRLEASADTARASAGEKLYRVWRIYLAGSAHAFERGWMSVYQVLAGRAGADGALAVPLTRDYMYQFR
jgi:cyclopropane-fatty-acyl-phospholipid synthase